jgi:hypothetical protein
LIDERDGTTTDYKRICVKYGEDFNIIEEKKINLKFE